MTRMARARRNLKTAARGGVVILLLGTLISGFGEPDDLILGSAVAGTPTVSILGGANGDGQVSGEVVSLNTSQGLPRVVLSTTGGYVTIVLADSMMVSGLGVGVIATFSGDFVSADTFNANQVLSNTLAGGDLTLGDPLTSPGSYGAPVGSGGVVLGGAVGGSSSGGSSGSTTSTSKGLTTSTCSATKSCPKLEVKVSKDDVDNGEEFKLSVEASDEDGIESMWWWATSTDDDYLKETHLWDCKNASPCKKSKSLSTTDEGDIVFNVQVRDGFGNVSTKETVEIEVAEAKVPNPTKTGTPTACTNDQDVVFTPEQGKATVGTTHLLHVTVTGGGNCSGKKAYVRVEGGQDPFENVATIASDNKATLGYDGGQGGSEIIRVWLDTTANQVFDSGEPFMFGEVEWQAPTATPTATSGAGSASRRSGSQATRTPTSKVAPAKSPTPVVKATAAPPPRGRLTVRT